MSEEALVMFAKAPQPGRVKTRLAADLGDAAAARLQAAFLSDLGRRFAGFEGQRWVAVTPDPGHPAFAELAAGGWRLTPQGDGDLGARLVRVVRRLRQEAGVRRLVIIGSDSPTLPMALVARARDALEERDLALGPVFDGGYYLVATRSHSAEPFRDIPWGTHRVYSTTVRRLESAGLSYAVLPFWYDVDDRRSLNLLADHLGLRGPCGRIEAPATARALRQIEGVGL